jgi:hypothetical protein
MKRIIATKRFAATIAFLVFSVGCAGSNNLRKFNEDNIGKEIPADVAKKFEVKDVSAAASPSPSPSEDLTATHGTKRHRKSKVPKKEDLPVASTSPTPAVPPNRRPPKMAFDVGEKLSYDIRYLGVTAGTFVTEVLPVKVVNNRKVYHLQAKAKTVKLFELVYRVDDVIESFWDYDGLFSYRFTMDLDESKQNRKLIELYDYDKNKSFYWNRVDHVEKGFSEKKEEYDIKPWSQDLVSSLFYIRSIDLPKAEGDPEVRFPVILDGKPWETSVKFLRKEKIYAGGKDREAIAYKIENYENGVPKNRENTLWMSDDEHRYVLRVETKVKVGSFAVALDKIL